MNKETLEEEVVTEIAEANTGNSKAKIVGIVAGAATLLSFIFRKKIGAGIEKRMVKKLTKKGYDIQPPVEVVNEKFADE